MLISQSALAGDLSIPFYKNKASQFPSGTASLADLNAILTHQTVTHMVNISKDGLDFALESHFLLSDLELSHRVLDLETNQINILIGCQAHHCQVQTPSSNFKTDSGQIKTQSKNKVALWPADLGKFVLWKDSPFIDAETKKVSQSRSGDTFLIIKLQHEYIHVEQLSPPYQRGFVKMSDGITKLDLAQYVLYKKQWLPVKYKTNEGMHLATDNHKIITFSQISGVLTKPNTLVATKEVRDIPIMPRSLVTYESEKIDTWSHGLHPHHGPICWKMRNESESPLSLTEIKKRRIYSVAHPPDREHPVLLSADGIFFSKDGVTFKKIPQFFNQNWPVGIDPKGYLYVGYKKSHPDFLDFHPFIRPEDLSKLFTSHNSEIKILDYAFDKKVISILAGWGSHKRWIKGAYHNSLNSPWSF